MPSSLTLLWVAATASLVAALLAWRKTRATARKLEQLSQMHWELKYQHGELRAQVQRLNAGAREAAPASDGEALPEGFIPLSSVRRQDS